MKRYTFLAACAIVVLSTTAKAQVAPPSEFTLKVNPTEASLLGEAMGLMPYGRIAPLMGKLQAQINEQNNPVPTSQAPVATNPKPVEPPAVPGK